MVAGASKGAAAANAPNPIFTRELFYTGILRAQDWLTLVETGRGMLDEAVTREVVRVSGLGDRLTFPIRAEPRKFGLTD